MLIPRSHPLNIINLNCFGKDRPDLMIDKFILRAGSNSYWIQWTRQGHPKCRVFDKYIFLLNEVLFILNHIYFNTLPGRIVNFYKKSLRLMKSISLSSSSSETSSTAIASNSKFISSSSPSVSPPSPPSSSISSSWASASPKSPPLSLFKVQDEYYQWAVKLIMCPNISKGTYLAPSSHWSWL